MPHIHRVTGRLGAEQIDEICQRYSAGESANALAKAFAVSKPAVLTLLRQRAVTVRSIRMSEEQINRAVQAYATGDSVATIAAELGFNPSGIWRALKNRGVQMRPKGIQPTKKATES